MQQSIRILNWPIRVCGVRNISISFLFFVYSGTNDGHRKAGVEVRGRRK